MSKRKIEFNEGEFFHVYNRGTQKMEIFSDSSDYARFVHYLYSFNVLLPDPNLARKLNDEGQAFIISELNNPLVDIAAFCLMPNHFHMLLRQRRKSGITQFMQKLGTAYTMYFNSRNQRTGVLFQGKFKAVHVQEHRYLSHLVRYIHLNPVDLYESGWKKKGLNDKDVAGEFLEKYKWSSYQDFIGKKNFPSVIDRSFQKDFFEPRFDHRAHTLSWLPEADSLIGALAIDCI